MDAKVLKDAQIAYGAYRGFNNGLHPATGTVLPVFGALAPAVQEAWGRAVVALRVEWGVKRS